MALRTRGSAARRRGLARLASSYASSALPRPGNGLADLHVFLAQAVMRDEAALDSRTRQIEALAREGRYPSGTYLPTLAGGFSAFERRDYSVRSKRWRRSWGKTNALAAAARSTT